MMKIAAVNPQKKKTTLLFHTHKKIGMIRFIFVSEKKSMFTYYIVGNSVAYSLQP